MTKKRDIFMEAVESGHMITFTELAEKLPGYFSQELVDCMKESEKSFRTPGRYTIVSVEPGPFTIYAKALRKKPDGLHDPET